MSDFYSRICMKLIFIVYVVLLVIIFFMQMWTFRGTAFVCLIVHTAKILTEVWRCRQFIFVKNGLAGPISSTKSSIFIAESSSVSQGNELQDRTRFLLQRFFSSRLSIFVNTEMCPKKKFQVHDL